MPPDLIVTVSEVIGDADPRIQVRATKGMKASEFRAMLSPEDRFCVGGRADNMVVYTSPGARVPGRRGGICLLVGSAPSCSPVVVAQAAEAGCYVIGLGSCCTHLGIHAWVCAHDITEYNPEAVLSPGVVKYLPKGDETKVYTQVNRTVSVQYQGIPNTVFVPGAPTSFEMGFRVAVSLGFDVIVTHGVSFVWDPRNPYYFKDLVPKARMQAKPGRTESARVAFPRLLSEAAAAGVSVFSLEELLGTMPTTIEEVVLSSQRWLSRIATPTPQRFPVRGNRPMPPHLVVELFKDVMQHPAVVTDAGQSLLKDLEGPGCRGCKLNRKLPQVVITLVQFQEITKKIWAEKYKDYDVIIAGKEEIRLYV